LRELASVLLEGSSVLPERPSVDSEARTVYPDKPKGKPERPNLFLEASSARIHLKEVDPPACFELSKLKLKRN
jgi:hypothetical protein